MNRRNFLSLFTAGVAGIALDQAIPLGRVWSFPKKILVGDLIMLPPGSTARVIEAWDFRIRGIVQRFDIIAPIFGATPLSLDRVKTLRLIRNIHEVRPEMVPEVPLAAFRVLSDAIDGQLKPDQFYGVHTRVTAAFPPGNSHTPS